MPSKLNAPVADTSSEVLSVPSHAHLSDLNQLTNSLHGDGFYPFKGTIDIGGIKNKKDVNGEVIVGTGKTIKVRDYVALIDGILVLAGNKEQIDFTQTTDYTVTGDGTVYITLEPATEVVDGEQKKSFDKATISESASAPEVDSGKILVATLTSVPVSGTITTEMINNTSKDYLKDVDKVYVELNTRLNEFKVDMIDVLTTEFEAFKTEITGDLTVVNAEITTINASLVTLQTQDTVTVAEIVTLYGLVATLNTEIYTVVKPEIATISSNLATAITNLTEAIDAVTITANGNTAEIDMLKTKVSSAEGIIIVLQTEVEAPTTGLLDRVMVLEQNPAVPQSLVDQIIENETDIDDIYVQLSLLGQGAAIPDVYIQSLIDAEVDSTNQVLGTLALDGITLDIDTAANDILADDFNLSDGPVDPAKWTVNGIMSIESNQLKVPYGSSHRILSIPTAKDSEIKFKMKFNQPDPYAMNFHDNYLKIYIRTNGLTGTHYNSWWFFNRALPDQSIGAVNLFWWKKTDASPALIKHIGWGSPRWVDGTPVNQEWWHLRLKQVGNRYQAWARRDDDPSETLLFDFTDENWGGYPYVDDVGNITFGMSTGALVDDIVIENPIPDAYFGSGDFTTSTLPSVDTITAVKVNPIADVPVDTDITYDISVNGGVGWTTDVTPGDFVDFSANPGTDLRVKVNYTTTDTAKTSTLTSLVVTSKGKFSTVSTAVKVVTGVGAAATIDLVDNVDEISSVKAYVAATGAPAAKTLLETTTDYTLSGTELTCVTDQSANKLEVIYTLKAV